MTAIHHFCELYNNNNNNKHEEVQIKHNTFIAAAKNLQYNAKANEMYKMQKPWQDKPLNAQHSAGTKEVDVDKPLTHQCLRSADLKAVTEGFILAVKDQC